MPTPFNPPITHIVTGFRRSGSSMMMKALIAGGMNAAWSTAQDQRLSKIGVEGYQLQQGESVYEPHPTDMNRWDFPRQHRGKLIKVLWDALPGLAPMSSGYRYVFMLRDPATIAASDAPLWLNGDSKTPHWLTEPGEYEKRMDLAIEALRNRKDTLSVTVLRMEDVIENPRREFARICDWPFDPHAAAEIPNAGVVRSKRPHPAVPFPNCPACVPSAWRDCGRLAYVYGEERCPNCGTLYGIDDHLG